jgi:hypothetical protein
MSADGRDESPETQQTQPKKGEPIEIPVPKREDFDRLVRRASEALRRHDEQSAQPGARDDPAKDQALRRLRFAKDEELAVFEDKLREDAIRAGATEAEIREAQRTHPEHG